MQRHRAILIIVWALLATPASPGEPGDGLTWESSYCRFIDQDELFCISYIDCSGAIHPWFSEDDRIFDKSLLGRWLTGDEYPPVVGGVPIDLRADTAYEMLVTRGPNKTYRILSLTNDGVFVSLQTATLAKIDGEYFLDLQIDLRNFNSYYDNTLEDQVLVFDDEDSEALADLVATVDAQRPLSEDGAGNPLIHSIFRVRFRAGHLTMWSLVQRRISEKLENSPLEMVEFPTRLQAKCVGQLVVSPTTTLREFLSKHGDDPYLWPDRDDFRRRD